jgi:hypothetical protein
MKSLPKLISNISIVLAGMLLFLCGVQNKIYLHPVLQSAGRLHPLILHFPIVLGILLAAVWFTRSWLDLQSFDKVFDLLFRWSICFALLSALLGLFLSREGGYDDDLIFKHKYLSVAYAFSLYVIFWFYQAQLKGSIISVSMLMALGLMVLGTHYGSELTHGKGFLLQPIFKGRLDQDSLTNQTYYRVAIEPVFRTKCFSCHNPQKKKGDLDMTSLAKLLEGGKEGPIWKPGDAGNSLILQNIHLAIDEKKHMPPNGKVQLTSDEIILLTYWINAGANTDSLFKSYAPTDSLYILAMKGRQVTESNEKVYRFPPAGDKVISGLNDPFCTITPLAQNSPALRADFYVREKYDPKKLQDLLKVKDQLVALNMDNMPVVDADLSLISKFGNLEELNLNNSSVTSNGLEELKKLKSLRLLSLAGTRLDVSAIQILSQIPSLRQVFIWNTGIKDSIDYHGKIEFNRGYVPDAGEVLALTPPTFINEDAILDSNEAVSIKHQIPGVIIRYTINDSIPDSSASPIYEKPIHISAYTTIKARAVKEGWLKSPVAVFSAFKKGLKPTSASLLSSPNGKYKADSYTLIDDQKGNISNLLEPGWIAYRESPMDVMFYFEKAPLLHRISVSYNNSVNSYIVPPTDAILLAGNDSSHLAVIKEVKLKPLEKSDLGKFKNDILNIDFNPGKYNYYRLKLHNVSKLPTFHPGKGQVGWLFVDEVFFY